MSRSSLRAHLSTRLAVGLSLLVSAVMLVACVSPHPPQAASTGAGSLPGITASTVTIGYTIVEGDELVDQFGFKNPGQGDRELLTKVINAYVAFVNDNGGMGGRKVIADIETTRPVPTDGQNNVLCDIYTRHRGVFAAVLDGLTASADLDCYRAAGTLVVDESVVAHDQTQFQQFAPYLWSPTHPEYGAFVAAQLAAMQRQSFFPPGTAVQVMSVDDDVSSRVTQTIVVPFLRSIGVNRIQTNYIDPSDTGTLSTSSAAALAAGTSGGFDRVIAVGGRVLPVALSNQRAQNYPSLWGISSWDNPAYLEANPDAVVTDRLYGMVGLGYAPAFDTTAAAGLPFPDRTRRAETLCKGILDAAGVAPGEGKRANYRSAFEYCDATFFLDAVLDKAPAGGNLSATQFSAAVGTLGTSYASSLTFGSEFRAGQYAATNVGRVLGFDGSCSCFQYKGENVPITTK